MALTTLLVDLDGTLYPIIKENDYEHHVRQNVFRYMHKKLRVPEAEVMDIWKAAFVKYNQTLKGLRQSGFTFNTEEYWDFIRDGAEKFLTPDPQVKLFFNSLPQKKWLFTNANEKSALHCLKLLDLEGVFEGVIGADSMGDVCKPEPAAFQKAITICGAAPKEIVMFEDSFKNLRTAKELGMTTVLIAGETATEEGVNAAETAAVVDALVIAPIETELRRTLPQLWA